MMERIFCGRVTDDGCVALPGAIRGALGLRAGTEVYVRRCGNSIQIVIAADVDGNDSVVGDFAGSTTH